MHRRVPKGRVATSVNQGISFAISAAVASWQGLRASPLPFIPPILNHFEHRLPSILGIDVCISHAHADLGTRICPQQPLEQQMSHQDAYKHATVASVFLLGTVVHGYESQPLS